MFSVQETAKPKKLQVAIDFLSSYGIAILIVLIAVAIAYQVSIGTTNLFSSQCTANPGFSCGYYSINNKGVLTLGLAQATGAAIIVNGVACSTQATSKGLPAYGNLYVTSAFNYYPYPYSPYPGVTVPSGGQKNFDLYCYGPTGIETTPSAGSSFVGYVWINYTIQNTKIQSTQQIAAVSLESISNGIVSGAIPVYSLTENTIPPGAGTVSPGSGNFLSGNIISLSQTANSGYGFVSWTCTGAGCYSGTNPIPNLFILSNTVETATFNVIYTFTENAVPPTYGTALPGNGNYISGNMISISATPIGNNVFASWTCTGTGCYSGPSSSYTFAIASNTVETANFQPPPTYTFTENAFPSGGGTLGGSGNGNYVSGNLISFSETPNSGYTFTSWTCTGTGCYSGTNTVANIIIASNTVETANFQCGGSFIFNTAGSNTLTVPSGCNGATLQLWGAGGGGGNVYAGAGSGYITGAMPVIPGSTLYIYVGGAGTYSGAAGTNGGGAGEYSGASGNGGAGGCSAVSTSGGTWNSVSLNANIFIVAAGGGQGGASGVGGAGGGTIGSNGAGSSYGSGGTQSAGGASTVISGSAFQGGNGNNDWGAGGCGYYGGGSANGGGGGGGSSWYNTGAVSSVTDTGGSGQNAGNPSGTIGKGGAVSGNGNAGEVIVTWIAAPANAATYSFTDNAVPSSEGTVSSSSGNYLSGSVVPFSATPNAGYAFASWSCSGTGCYSGPNAVANVVITSNTVETANFQCGGSFIFSTAGSNTFTLPATCGHANLQLWGAGGGSYPGSNGAGGGYITGNIAVTPGNILYIYVGGAGGGYLSGGPGTNGGGAGAEGAGGCSAVSTSSGTWNSVGLNANILIVAAGGAGGSGYGSINGAGGGTTGSNGGTGHGGTQSAGGTAGSGGVAGSAWQGGSSSIYGGGGCGYFGGGSGNNGGGGGGGSSWYSTSIVSSVTDLGGNGINPGGNTVSGYSAPVGQGGAGTGNGNSGEVIITSQN